jgi:hypothetical protein
LRKDELIENLDEYLQQNATRLTRNPSFEPYYGTRRTPFKARSSSAAGAVTSDDGEVKSIVKARGRRTTKVKQEVYVPVKLLVDSDGLLTSRIETKHLPALRPCKHWYQHRQLWRLGLRVALDSLFFQPHQQMWRMTWNMQPEGCKYARVKLLLA